MGLMNLGAYGWFRRVNLVKVGEMGVDRKRGGENFI